MLEEMETIELNVEGMSCQNCVRHVRETISAVQGVDSVEVSLEGKRAVFQATNVDTDAVIHLLSEEGYEASIR